MRVLLPLLVIPIISACPGPDAREPMTKQLEIFDQQLALLAAEVDRHAEAMAKAQTLSEVTAAEADHQSVAMAAVFELKTQSAMIHAMCLDSSNTEPRTQEMTDVAELMQQECENHKAAVAAAATLGAAQEEELRHHQAMDELEADLKAERAVLEPIAATYLCDHTASTIHNHEH